MPRGKTYDNAAVCIGDTPMIRINRLVPSDGAAVFAKCEFFQPLNSVKDRIGAAMIAAGEKAGKINQGTHIVEPTSGNTGIALAFVCAAKGYKLTLDDARIDVGRTSCATSCDGRKPGPDSCG
jgi:cysteine synthase